jgi:predicted membrane chloride channel (bestrophin family)
MERTFLFFYVFTAPFVMLNDDSSGLALCLAIFLMTYGFIGLEIVAIDLDDPFGSDANDFDNMASATCVFEDAYLAIRDVDGEEWVDRLRQKMNEEASEAGQVDEYAWLLTDTRP